MLLNILLRMALTNIVPFGFNIFLFILENLKYYIDYTFITIISMVFILQCTCFSLQSFKVKARLKCRFYPRNLLSSNCESMFWWLDNCWTDLPTCSFLLFPLVHSVSMTTALFCNKHVIQPRSRLVFKYRTKLQLAAHRNKTSFELHLVKSEFYILDIFYF